MTHVARPIDRMTRPIRSVDTAEGLCTKRKVKAQGLDSLYRLTHTVSRTVLISPVANQPRTWLKLGLKGWG